MEVSVPVPRRDLRPILRWAGGKRWAAEAVRQVGNAIQATSYAEPFLGGAAVFFGGEWPQPVLGDINKVLVRCYRGIAGDPSAVRRKLASLPVDRSTFERVIRWRPYSESGVAARLLYLNRAAYAGMYRVNKSGLFNVPFSGDRDLSAVLIGTRLEDAGRALAGAQLVHGGFSEVLARSPIGALIYCDPPYALPGAEQEFRRYSCRPFNWTDQVRLAEELRAATERGSCVVLSNSADEAVRELYRDAQVLVVARRSSLARARRADKKEALYIMHPERRAGELLIGVLARHL